MSLPVRPRGEEICLREAAFSCARTRAELDHKETASHESRISRKHALSSRKLRYADSSSYATLKRCAASKCLLKRARLLLRSFVRAWHPWRIGSWKERFKAKGQAKRAARKTSLPIKLPFRYHSTFPYRPIVVHLTSLPPTRAVLFI